MAHPVTIHRCACGAGYTRATWSLLPLAGYVSSPRCEPSRHDPGDPFTGETRRCSACGSHITRELAVTLGDVLRFADGLAMVGAVELRAGRGRVLFTDGTWADVDELELALAAGDAVKEKNA